LKKGERSDRFKRKNITLIMTLLVGTQEAKEKEKQGGGGGC